MIELGKTEKDKKSTGIAKKKGKKRTGSSLNIVQSRFYDELNFAETQQLRIEFDELVDEITKQGEKFSKNPTHEELSIYKSMIKQFLKHATDNMFRVEYHTGGRMKQKIYTLMKIIDEKLEALTRLVLDQQTKNIDLLATLDEIRGLLIDLYK